MHELTDTHLIQMTRAGNRDAFGVLFERYLGMAQNIAYQIVHDRAIAEDIAQDAMLQAYLSLDNLKESARYSSWLHGIVRNLSHNHLRRHAKGAVMLGDAMDDWRVGEFYSLLPQPNGETSLGGDPAHFLEQKTRQESIREALARLPAKRQEAAVLFYLEQLSIREIAQKLNASETAIKSRLFQARKQLQTQLTPLLIEPSFNDTRSFPNGKPVIIERNQPMIKIDAVHAFERDDNKNAIILFLAKKPLCYMQMWIGIDVGFTLMQILKGEETPRPLTHNTMAEMLDLLDAKVSRVEVNALQETTFYSIIHVESAGGTKQLDARPSDAVTLALIADAPIYVADEVMETMGHDLPSPFDEAEWLEAKKAEHREQVQQITKWQDAFSTEETKLTTRAQQVFTVMMAEAERYAHPYIGSEHLLLALVAVKQGLAGRVLSEMGVTYESIDELVEQMVGRTMKPAADEPTIVPRVVQCFELAEAERKKMRHVYIGTEHLLLGILAEAESESSDKGGMAMQFLQKLDVESSEVRQKLEAVFKQGD